MAGAPGPSTTAGPLPRGGTLRIGVPSFSTLDPAQARTLEQQLVADQLFDGLTAADPVTHLAVPAVAASWSATPDQKIWTFDLRPDALFGSGRPVTAADVVNSLERVARPDRAPLETAQLLELVTGFAAFRASTDPAAHLAGITAVDGTHVRIALDQPWSDLPLALSNPALGIVPAEAASQPSFGQSPVGSGPFTFSERRGTTVVLKRAPGSRALVDALELTPFPSKAAAYDAFVKGTLDWAEVPVDQVDDARGRFGAAGFASFQASLFYGFNLKAPAFADLRFRQAIVKAIDRDAIVKAVYGGTVRRLDGILVDGIPGFAETACAACAFDPNGARALIAQAFPAGTAPPVVQLDLDDEATDLAIAKAIQANLLAVGLAVEIRSKPLSDYETFVQQGQQQLFQLAWVAAYPSADAFLPPLFQSTSPNNLVGLSDPAVDAALAAARSDPDPATRQAKWSAAEQAVLAAAPVIPLGQFQLSAVVSPRTKGLVPTVTGTFDAAAVSVGG